MKQQITIFTPTYNRKTELQRLYESLCGQTNKDFEWLIVDDGSTDHTDELVSEWTENGPIRIKYVYQNNQGKASAHNRGVTETESPLFTCVDSDDYLTEDAVDTILKTNLSSPRCIGALYKKGLSATEPVTRWTKKTEYSTLYHAYHGGTLEGDTMLVFKTDVLKKHSFPAFPGEKFVPEAYIYDQLDQEGELLFVDRILYICEYLEGGYTSNIRKMNARNPHGYLAFIKQRIDLYPDRSKKELAEDLIRYISIKLVVSDGSLLHPDHRFMSVLCLLPGWLFYLRQYREYLK